MGKRCNSDQWCKERHLCEKDYIWNPSICNCENGKYLASIVDDSAITSDEIIESYDEETIIKKTIPITKTIPTNFNERKATCKTRNFYILLAFLLITIALLIAVSVYCYLIKYQVK